MIGEAIMAIQGSKYDLHMQFMNWRDYDGELHVQRVGYNEPDISEEEAEIIGRLVKRWEKFNETPASAMIFIDFRNK
jgi:sulfur relay (sulfurtransferase) DsrC/TusE family protein